jgi:hypothetical protein
MTTTQAAAIVSLGTREVSSPKLRAAHAVRDLPLLKTPGGTILPRKDPEPGECRIRALWGMRAGRSGRG